MARGSARAATHFTARCPTAGLQARYTAEGTPTVLENSSIAEVPVCINLCTPTHSLSYTERVVYPISPT